MTISSRLAAIERRVAGFQEITIEGGFPDPAPIATLLSGSASIQMRAESGEAADKFVRRVRERAAADKSTVIFGGLPE